MSSVFADQARRFSDELAATLSAFTGKAVNCELKRLEDRFIITEEDAQGVPLPIRDDNGLSVSIVYKCEQDSQRAFLAVRESSIKVHGSLKPGKDPLFRYEYEDGKSGGLPSAHLHVHAHRDQMSLLLGIAGLNGGRARASLKKPASAGRMSTLHFPVGGPRFRPALEDVLQMVSTEFGIKPGSEWSKVLVNSRIRYRRSQTAAVIRDCPAEAVRVLETLGLKVVDAAGERVLPEGLRDLEKTSRLREV
ncbi:hypothetical protein [Arthrobacter sp. UM1]|uniref:hypothetical protein n=1 Tax=Arthrobacter sp. UM1 TaxID=2766776 RepID=UPI001CF63724|nr:hypothetical protein [Arthrobacter sp. UM1]MCB4208783.1 hypothetical protein [Arthrobacter sp. UM1]